MSVCYMYTSYMGIVYAYTSVSAMQVNFKDNARHLHKNVAYLYDQNA